MKRFLEILGAVLLLIWIVLSVSAGWIVYKTYPSLKQTVDEIQTAATVAAETSEKQSTNLDLELKETRKATADVHDLLIHTDCSLNGCRKLGTLPAVPGVLPEARRLIVSFEPVVNHLNDAAAHLDAAIQNANLLVESGTATVTELQNSLKQIDGFTRDLDAEISDPSIKNALDALDKAAQNAPLQQRPPSAK